MNLLDYLAESESSNPRITFTRIDDNGSEADTQSMGGVSDTGEDDTRIDLDPDLQDADKDDDHKDERKSAVQRAVTALNDLDDYLQGNGAQDVEFGSISDDVVALRDRLKTKIKSCKAPAKEAPPAQVGTATDI